MIRLFSPATIEITNGHSPLTLCSEVVASLSQTLFQSDPRGFEAFAIQIWWDEVGLIEHDRYPAERLGDNETIPGFEPPGCAVADVDGYDFRASRLRDLDDTGLYSVARAFRAVGRDADI